jgi:hypothetical protein
MPITTDRDILRLEISDTDATTPLFTDDQLDVFLDRHPGKPLAAAADAAQVLAMRFARQATLTLTSGSDTVKRDYSKMADTYNQLAATLRARATAASGSPWHGGSSRSRKDSLAAEADRVQPKFRRGQFNVPGDC